MKFKAITLASIFLGLGFSFVACTDENENPILPTTFTAVLNGTNEKPTATSSKATGSFRAILDESTSVLSYTVVYEGLTPTMGHLHRIDTTRTDGTGPIDIPFPSLTSPITGSTSALTPLQIYRLKHGQYYANLHTAQYPAGEIRGEIRTK
ncbi:MAG: CHRD domain-containing protein [Spirosoma sp.]|nr:CHRD domain-containing protein [Spirosoma sp.]OJW71693.1 MAG: CHRD domain-containing protein [Spirosoma sp. 48-14]